MKGFIQIPLLILLLIGTGASVYLIQQKTHFLPQAFSGKEILNIFSDQPIATGSSTLTSTYKLPTSTPTKQSNTPFISAFQRILQRTLNQSPVPTVPTPPAKTALPTPTITPMPSPTFVPTPVVYPSPTPNQNSSALTSKPKPICGVLVMPSNTGNAPYQASVCVGNNSNPYQSVQQELVDYDGNGSWDYQGPSYGCHSFTFQNPGNYFPKAKIVSTSGQESDICQTSTTISAANPTPTPTSTPSPSPVAAQSCSRVTVEGATFVKTYQGQNGLYYQYSINSGATAKLTAQVTPAGGYVRWTKGGSINLPNDGTFTYPNSNNTSIVNWTAPNNPVSTEEGVDIRGDISEYPNTWKYCPTITFAVKPA